MVTSAHSMIIAAPVLSLVSNLLIRAMGCVRPAHETRAACRPMWLSDLGGPTGMLRAMIQLAPRETATSDVAPLAVGHEVWPGRYHPVRGIASRRRA